MAEMRSATNIVTKYNLPHGRVFREMKSSWWEKKTRALKAAVDSHDAKTFFNELKAVYGLQSRGTSPIIFISQHFNKLERKLRKRTICDIPGDSNSKAGYVNHV